MSLSDYVHTFGQYMLQRHGERVHKLTLNAGFTCPNRDGEKGIGGCTFCNNVSFSPMAKSHDPIAGQLQAGREVVLKRTRAKRYIAYFQAYTNTYAEVAELRKLYDQALESHDVVGLSVGTRPDCVPPEVLELLREYQDQGHEMWLELGLQSASDEALAKVNRGHGFAEYKDAVTRARDLGLNVCTHLIVGLPGEGRREGVESLERVLELGVEGLKIHPLHVVKQTMLANQWRRGEYEPLTLEAYVAAVADMVERTPPEVVYHRVVGSAPLDILLAPKWCHGKWKMITAIEQEFARRGTVQGSALGTPFTGAADVARTHLSEPPTVLPARGAA